MKVKFSDVVRRANTKEDRFNTDKEFYVGGEHMITGEYLITRRGTIAGSNIGPMFYFGFKKGQVLLASRSPDLKKAGMVTFDGICSEKTFVIETKDESVLLQDFLPAIVRSESFWKYANDNQSGSVNHFINWTTFANYEFDLPDIETQRKLSALLWAMERTKTAYKNLIAKTDELVKSQFVEMFGEFKRNTKGWPVLPFEKFATIDANMTTDYEKYADYPHIGIDSIEKETGELKGYRTVKDDGVISGKYVFTPEHIIYSKIRPNLNKVALPSFCGLCSADAYPILPNPDVCSRTFLAYVMRSAFFLDYILQFSARSNMPKVNRKEIAGFKSPMPPLTMQKEFETFVAQADKSQFVEMFGLPDSNGHAFEIARIGDVVCDVHYGTSRKALDDGEFTYLRMNNITYGGELDLTDTKRISVPDKELAGCIVKKGDVLFNRTNSRELVGKTCAFKLDEPMIIAGYIIRLRMNGRVLPEYLSAFLNLDSSKKLLFTMAKGAVGQANINAQEVQSIQIVVPPMEAQISFQRLVEQSDKSKFVALQTTSNLKTYGIL